MMRCTVCHKPYVGPKNHYVSAPTAARRLKVRSILKESRASARCAAREAKMESGATAISSRFRRTLSL